MLTTNNNKLMLTKTAYDVFKKLVQLWIPAFGTLYLTLAGIWDLDYAEEVSGTCVAVAAFLGIGLTVSNRQYESSGAAYDGQLVATTPVDGNGGTLYSLDYDGDLDEIPTKDSITFKVVKPAVSEYNRNTVAQVISPPKDSTVHL